MKTNRTDFLKSLEVIALDCLARTQREPVNEDDEGMFGPDANSSDLIDWVDDLEARVGLDVADFRSAVVDYCLVLDRDPEASEVCERHGVVL